MFINTLLTLAYRVRHDNTDIMLLSYTTIQSYQWRSNRRSSCIDPEFHSLRLSSDVNVTIDWPIHQKTWQFIMGTRKVISYSLYIDFVHADIGGGSCKKIRYMISYIHISFIFIRLCINIIGHWMFLRNYMIKYFVLYFRQKQREKNNFHFSILINIPFECFL